MKTLQAQQLTAGREFMGRLPHGRDMVTSIESFCNQHQIETAVLSLIGAVSTVTLGAYDQKQQVYVTFERTGNLEIVSGWGNISLKDGRPFVHAHLTLADEQGQLTGGHLFSETICFAGEIHIRELTGWPLQREYDKTTGLMLWDMGQGSPDFPD